MVPSLGVPHRITRDATAVLPEVERGPPFGCIVFIPLVRFSRSRFPSRRSALGKRRHHPIVGVGTGGSTEPKGMRTKDAADAVCPFRCVRVRVRESASPGPTRAIHPRHSPVHRRPDDQRNVYALFSRGSRIFPTPRQRFFFPPHRFSLPLPASPSQRSPGRKSVAFLAKAPARVCSRAQDEEGARIAR